MGRLDGINWDLDGTTSPRVQENVAGQRAQIVYIKPEKMVPYQDEDGKPQRFHQLSEEELKLLAIDLQHNGMIDAVHAVQVPGKPLMLFIGHNRRTAELLRAKLFSGGETREIPCIIHNANDTRIAAQLVSSNLLRREKLFPSERAYAYSQLQKSYYISEIAEGKGVDRQTIYRYLALNNLHPSLLIKVDKGKYTIVMGAAISVLPQQVQVTLDEFFEENKLGKIKEEHVTAVCNFLHMSKEGYKRVFQFTELSKKDCEEIFADYIKEKKAAEKKGARKKTFANMSEAIASYYPEDCAPEKIEESIVLILDRLKKENRLAELIGETLKD